MNKLYVFLLTLVLCMGLHAEDQFVLSYCNHEINTKEGKGSDTAGEIAAAIYVPQSKLKTLVGNAIARIDVGLVSRINVRNLTVWVRHDLNGENLVQTTIERGSLGWNEITLTTPYTIKAEDQGLYIGYTYTNPGTSHTVSFVGDGQKGSSFFKAKATEEWEDMAADGNLSLEAIVTGSQLPLYDLSLNHVSLTPQIALGPTGYRLTGEVSNLAVKDVTGFTLTLEDAQGDKQDVKASCTVKSGQTMVFTVDFVSNTTLNGLVKVSIAALDNGTDANMDNNSATGSVAFLRNVVVEEFTTERCPNCPPAATGLHQALTSNELYDSRVIAVCHHAGFYTDWLTRQCDKDLLSLYNDDGSTFAPAFMFDRQPLFESAMVDGQKDNVVSIRLKDDFVECIEKALAIPTHALVGITVKEVTASAMTFEVSILADDDFKLANPILTVYATEDAVKAQTQQGSDAETYYHQHVIRWDNGTWGDEVTMTDHAFKATYTIPLDGEWVKEKMHIVAFVSNRDAGNILNHAVENAATVHVADILTDISSTSSVTPTVLGKYTISGQPATSNAKGIIIVRYSDGRNVKVMR